MSAIDDMFRCLERQRGGAWVVLGIFLQIMTLPAIVVMIIDALTGCRTPFYIGALWFAACALVIAIGFTGAMVAD